MLGQDGGFECLLLQLWCFVVGIGWVVSWLQCDRCRDSERVQIESPKIRISATSPSLFLEEKVCLQTVVGEGGGTDKTHIRRW